MNGPLFAFADFSLGASLLLALAVGFSFGFFLERGGLGNPHKLIGVFLLKDFAVPKVMFTAIVVAGVGLYLLSVTNLMDLSRMWLVPTYFWPQLVGGALFGIGFFVSGYCPGTAVAGFSAGRVDALVTLLGVSTGSLFFAVVFPLIEDFYDSSPMPGATIDSVSGLPYGLVIVILVAVAAGMFIVIGKFEAGKVGAKPEATSR